MAEDRYRIYSQEVETVDMNLAFGELWLDLSQASFASDQVAVHLDAKFVKFISDFLTAVSWMPLEFHILCHL